MIFRLFPALAVTALLTLTAGCAALGERKASPDAFTVSTRAPLVIPPDYTLRPPRPGAPRPQERDAQDQAMDALFGDGSAAPPKTPGEEALMDATGARRVAQDIRTQVRDDGTLLVNKGSFLKDLLAAPLGDHSPADARIVIG